MTFNEIIHRALASSRCPDITRARIFRRRGKTFVHHFRANLFGERWDTTQPVSGMALFRREVTFIPGSFGDECVSADAAWDRYLHGECVYPALMSESYCQRVDG